MYDKILGRLRWVDNAKVGTLTEVVDSATTSAYIPVLSGGTCYRFTQPLTSLSIGSIASSIRESVILFTAGGVAQPLLTLRYVKGEWEEWDEDAGEDVTKYVFCDLTLSGAGGSYTFAPDSYRLYREGPDNEYGSYLSGGSFTCVSAGGKWGVSAHDVKQICSDNDEVTTRTINGWIASGTTLYSWSYNDAVTIRLCRWDDNEGILQDAERSVEDISTSSQTVPCGVALPSGALLVNSDAITLEIGQRYEMNIKYGAIVTGKWQEANA